MTHNRQGENGVTPIRQERVFQKDEYWYYKTREGATIGPFDSREYAEEGVDEFVAFISSANPKVLETLSQCAGAA